MLMFRAIISSALLTIFSAASLYLADHQLDFDPWVAGITVFALGFIIAIINRHLISGFFEHERWGRLPVPPRMTPTTSIPLKYALPKRANSSRSRAAARNARDSPDRPSIKTDVRPSALRLSR